MTSLNSAIKFNNGGSGSDSAASGCGPSTPISVMLQTSGGSNTATASWTGTLSAGDLMYIPDSSFTGRKFNVIASVGSGSLTFDDNWDDSSFGTSGYVGGKRATLDNADSRLAVGTDASGKDWVVELENTGTDYAITSTVQTRSATIQGNDESNPTGVTFNQNADLFSGRFSTTTIKNLHLKCTASSKTLATAISKGANQAGFNVYNTTFDATDNWNKAFGRSAIAAGNLRVFKCRINNTITNISDWDTVQQYYECVFTNCTGNGIKVSSNHCIVKSCLFNGCAGNLIYQAGNPGNYWVIQGNIFNGGSEALRFYTYTYQTPEGSACDNIFSNLTSTAIANSATHTGFLISRNAFYNNTANYSGTHEDNVTVQQDPYVDASGGDFNLNNALSGGSVLRSTKFTLGG